MKKEPSNTGEMEEIKDLSFSSKENKDERMKGKGKGIKRGLRVDK